MAVLAGVLAAVAVMAMEPSPDTPWLALAAVATAALAALALLVRVSARRADPDDVAAAPPARILRALNLPMPESPHVHRPLADIEYAPRTALGHAPFVRAASPDHETPTVAYGTRGYSAPSPSYIPPPYIQQPYVAQPYVQQRARSFPPVPTNASDDDGPTTYDPSAQTRAEQHHAELARAATRHRK